MSKKCPTCHSVQDDLQFPSYVRSQQTPIIRNYCKTCLAVYAKQTPRVQDPMKLTKASFIILLSEKYSFIPKTVLSSLISFIFDVLRDHVLEGGHVEIRGFGTFSCKKVEQKNRHNPKTREDVHPEARNKVHFRPGSFATKNID